MTKDAYFEICEALGSEPIESEIPIDYEDFCLDVQEALGVYQKLRDEWDSMQGIYLGKSYAGILDIFTRLGVLVEDHKTMFDLVGMIDSQRSKDLADARPKSK
jgi:hypothetical protein